MSIISPAYREKRRYILVKVDNNENFKEEFKNKFIYFFGIFGLAKAGIVFLIEKERNVIIRVTKKYLPKTLLVLYSLGIKDIRIASTLKKIKSYL